MSTAYSPFENRKSHILNLILLKYAIILFDMTKVPRVMRRPLGQETPCPNDAQTARFSLPGIVEQHSNI